MAGQTALRSTGQEAVRVRRELRAGDREAIVELHRRVYPPEYGVDETFVRDIELTLDELERVGWPGPRDRTWIVEAAGETAGMLLLTDEGDGVGQVRLFLLAAELRGAGLGRTMLSELLAEARALGFERLILYTFSDLKGAAHLYRDAGFEVVWQDEAPRWGRSDLCYQRYELELTPAGEPGR